MPESEQDKQTQWKLAGSLDVIPLDQVCQVVASSGKTGVLGLDFGGPQAKIFFEDGLVTAAEFGRAADQEALNAICKLKRGVFFFQPGPKAPHKRMRAPVSTVLLEAYRLADEAAPESLQAPPPERRPTGRMERRAPPPRPEGRDFLVAGNVLYVYKDLINPLDMAFDIACQKLLDAPSALIVIDLTSVRGINSQYIGVLATVAGSARRKGRQFVVRAKGVVARTLEQLGFDQLMKLEVEE
jgi:hypothetical protein